jgi:DNA-binding XRE family transcriptional regulator
VSLFATVKTDRIWVQVRGIIPESLLHVLRREFSFRLRVRSEIGERMRNVLDSPLYRQEPREMTPGDWIKLFRQNAGFTQAELGRRLGGVGRQNVCGMERDRRPIGRRMAVRLGRVFGASTSKFIEDSAFSE